MEKRKFGMACLNISQGRYNEYSHKGLNAYDLCGMDSGIDRFKTFSELEVIGIWEYSKTGFANTVCFYDRENDVTLAFTHMNNLDGYYVGKKFKDGETIYFEGTKGQATGNHIHLELGKGYQKGKTKINGKWQLKDLINIEDYFYIDTSYTTVKDDKGYWKKVEEMKLIEGYQELSWLGSKVKVYKQKKKQDIGMMSAKGSENWKALQTIDKIDNEFIHYCKINCNFFDMRTGQHYGVEQSFENDFAPKQNEWYCLYIDKDNKPHYALSSDYWLSKNDVKLACSPYAILRHNGEDLKLTSSGANQHLETYTNNTLLLYLEDGSYAFMVTDNKLNSLHCLDFAKNYGAIGVYEFDGGGSSQMIVDGKKVQYTGRAIANVLTFFEMLESEPQKPTPSECGNCKKLEENIIDLKNENATLLESNKNLHHKNEELRAILGRINELSKGV